MDGVPCSLITDQSSLQHYATAYLAQLTTVLSVVLQTQISQFVQIACRDLLLAWLSLCSGLQYILDML